MSIEQIRRDFDLWHLNRFSEHVAAREAHAAALWMGGKEVMWIGWQASRESLVVELPKRVGYEHRNCEIEMSRLEPDQDEHADESFALVRAVEVREAIEAAGVRVLS